MKAISIWISEEEHSNAKKEAVRQDLSLSQLVRKLLRDATPEAHANN